MTRSSFAASVLSIVGAAALVAPPPASAGEIRINGGGCASVHLVARDVPLSDVLKRLSKALDFEIVDDSGSDALVSVDVTRHPVELVAGLAPLENISMTLEQNPRCPLRARIVKVWVLPSGQGAAARASAAANPHPSSAEAEQARRTQAGIDMVLRAHGMPSPANQRTESKQMP